MPNVKATVVICDDHPLFREGLATALADTDAFDVIGEAGTLGELTALVDRRAPDLILLDVDLPDGSGVDAVRTLAPTAKVLVVSAHDDVALVVGAMRDGAIGFVRKDADPAELLRLVGRAAAGQTALNGEMALRVAESLRSPDSPTSPQIGDLSPRQREVARLVADGLTNREIADAMCLSEGTVKNHVTRILDHANVPDRTKLAVLVARGRLRL